MITTTDISLKLAEAIRQSGMSQQEIAKRIGVKQQQISSYLKGKTLPALDTLANLCNVLELDANDILCLKSNFVKD